MSTTLSPLAFELVLPWHLDEKRERAFYRTLKTVLVPIIILFLLMPFLEQIDTGLAAPEKPLIITKIILQPPKPIAKPILPILPSPIELVPIESPIIIPPPKDMPKAPSLVKETAGAKKGAKGKDEAPVKLGPEDTKAAFVKSQALSDLSSQLRSLRGAIDVAKMQNKNVSNSTGGTVAASDREILGEEVAQKRGGGRGLANNEKNMRGDIVGLGDHVATSVDGVPGGTGGGGGYGGNSPNGGKFSNLSGQSGRRDMESIRATLEAVKSSVYTLYQRALVNHPDLAGKFTFSIVIEPNGSISSLKLVGSELGLKELDNDILARIKRVNFGAKEVSATAVEYKFVFLPS
jgi:hypothetical protein